MALTGNVDTEQQLTISVAPQRSLACFTDLDPTDNNKYIEAQVYRKWTTIKVRSLIPTGFSCILLDKKVRIFLLLLTTTHHTKKEYCSYKKNTIPLITGLSYTSKYRFERK